MINKINTKIIQDLMIDGRKSFSEIANEVNLSTDAICKRYKEMKKTGIMAGSTVHFNYKSYGWELVTSISLDIVPNSDNKEILEKIKKIPEVLTAVILSNKQLITVVVFKEVEDLNAVRDIMSRIPNVLRVKTSIWTGIKNVPENLSIFKKNIAHKINNKKQSLQNKNSSFYKMDEIDKKIINELIKNGRQPFSSISKKTGISITTITRRYQKMKNHQLIRVIQQVNPKKLGYKGILSMNVSFSNKIGTNKLAQYLTEIPDVYLTIQTSGDQDFFIIALIKSVEAQLLISKKIEALENIWKINYRIYELGEVFPGPGEYISTT